MSDVNTQLKVSLGVGVNDSLNTLGLILVLAGGHAVPMYYLSTYEGHASPFAVEILTALSALVYLGSLLLSKPLVVTVDKAQQTVVHGQDKRAISRSIQGAKSVVLLAESEADGNDRRSASFRVFIDASTEVPIATYTNLSAAKALAGKISNFLSIPLDDQSQNPSAQHAIREARSAHIAERRTLQHAQPKLLQVTLRSTIILMLCASVLLGIVVNLHGSKHPLAPLAGPAGFLFLVALAHVLDRRR